MLLQKKVLLKKMVLIVGGGEKRVYQNAAHAAKALRWRIEQLLECLNLLTSFI